jgi:hypothetical protein
MLRLFPCSIRARSSIYIKQPEIKSKPQKQERQREEGRRGKRVKGEKEGLEGSDLTIDDNSLEDSRNDNALEDNDSSSPLPLSPFFIPLASVLPSSPSIIYNCTRTNLLFRDKADALSRS